MATRNSVDVILLLWKTLLLRPYVFFFLAVALGASFRLLGRTRTAALFGITWLTAFLCEISSTRIGFPFGDYYYTGSSVGEELYLFNVPFMDSLSFTFLLFASYSLALWLLLPAEPGSPNSSRDRHVLTRESLSWPVIGLTAALFMLIDVVIDPVALRGDRWFLGQIYGYPNPGVYFGVPLANFGGWFIVGLIAMTSYRMLDRRLLPAFPHAVAAREVLLGCGLYYGVLLFNLTLTFWIGEWLLGMVGCLLYAPVTALALLKLRR